MTERKPPRDIWKQPPEKSRPVEEELADSPALADADAPETEPSAESPAEEPGYAPRHRAPGRAPLIRRRRNRPEDPDDVEVTWETTWRERDDNSERSWIDKEESIVAPPQRPIEDLPYLGPRRSERKRKPAPSEPEDSPELIRKARDYTGRHLAPKKPSGWGRATEGDVEEFADRSELDRPEARAEAPPRRRRTFVEGDVRDEPESGLFARPWRSRRGPSPSDTRGSEAEEVAPQQESEPASADDRDTELEEIAAEAAATVAPEESVPEAETEVSETPPSGAAETTGEISETEAEIRSGAAEELVEEEPSPAEVVALEESAEPPPPPAAVTTAPSAPDAVEDVQLTFEGEGADADADADADEDAPLGPRTAALQERKKKKKVRQTAGGVLAAVLALGAIVGVGLLAKRVVDPPKEKVAVPLQEPPAEPPGGSTLFFGTREDAAADRGAIWMTLFHYDAENDKASIVYIPPHTAVEVPGRGLQGVGEAYGSGGIPLLLVATENLLGVSVDRYVELSDTDARVFFEGIGPITVDVPAEVRVPAGKDQARLIFVDGPQELTPDLLVKLLYIVGIDGDDVELGSRHLAFWDALLDQYEDPEEIAALFEGAGAALGESDAPAEEHAEFFASIAALEPEQRTITALPVRPISAGDSELYATDEDELAEFVASTIGTGRDKPAEIRVQVLNGNGVPGIGQEVANRLVGEGFRVILSGNARRLNYKKTLVIAYDSSETGIGLAERARELLGVGEVQVSAQQQGIVDLTIVVGKDFLRAR